VEMTPLVTYRNAPGSKTKFLCFRKCMHGGYTRRKKRVGGFVALLQTEVPNPEGLLSFQ
jgi:hypothetical protein